MKNSPLKEPLQARATNFFQYDLWSKEYREARGIKGLFYKALRVFFIACHGFLEDNCLIRASALTYYSLMATVPILALTFAIAQAFGYQNHLEQQILEHFVEQRLILKEVMYFAHNLLENTKGGVIAGLGVVLLFWSSLKVLSHTEESLNHIWGIKKPRSWKHKLSDYLTLLLIGPLIFIVASSITVLIVSTLKFYILELPLYDTISSFLIFLVQLIPYCLIWVLFTFIYVFMPNTKVRFLSALIAGVLAGTIYQLLQWVYIIFQIGISRYGAIYGSFAAIPLFLFWIQLSWYILLMGAEVSFAIQNLNKFSYGWKISRASHSFRMVLCLWITHYCLHAFIKQKGPVRKDELQRKLQIPFDLFEQCMMELVEAKILCQVQMEKESGYQIARPPENLRICDVVHAVEDRGDKMPELQNASLDLLKSYLSQFSDEVVKSDKNRLLKDIAAEE
jgi:membrane protein